MLYALARPLLFALDPETAHHADAGAGRRAAAPALLRVARLPAAPVRAMGLEFPNPVGLAAGLDKDARARRRARRARLRLPRGGQRDAAAAAGQSAAAPVPHSRARRRSSTAWASTAWASTGSSQNLRARELARRARRQHRQEQGHADRDRRPTITRRAWSASTRTRATSRSTSPRPTRRACASCRARTRSRPCSRGSPRCASNCADRHGRHVPLALKIAPDLETRASPGHRRRRCAATASTAVIATNTTVSRAGVESLSARDPDRRPVGRAAARARHARRSQRSPRRSRARFRIIGVGGILSGEDAVEKLAAGATLVQFYTGLDLPRPGTGERMRGKDTQCASACSMKRSTVALIDEARCIGCARCIDACPVDAIAGAPGLMHTVIAAYCTGCELCLPRLPGRLHRHGAPRPGPWTRVRCNGSEDDARPRAKEEASRKRPRRVPRTGKAVIAAALKRKLAR